ncbi:MAG: hypothetical protein AAF004_07365 [Pseudomonadota bacterium]
MSRIGPTDSLRELARLLGVKARRNTKTREGNKAREPAPQQKTLEQSLAEALQAIALDDDEGRQRAHRLIISRIVSERMAGNGLDAAQLAYVSQQVADKVRSRPQIADLLDRVMSDLGTR